ncbi:YceK/YidQ family lipoprotein [Pseudomonas sp. SIMBA_077]
MTYKLSMLCVVPWLLLGCGSAKTLLGSDASVSRDLKKQRTYCESISRVYSGVAFDLCVMNAPPSTVSGVPEGFVPIFFFEVLASAVIDTVALPYTIFQQHRDGSLLLR